MSGFGNRIRYVRESHGLSVKEFSESLEIKEHTLRDVESERQRVHGDILNKIVTAFRVNAFWLLTGVGQMSESNKPKDSISKAMEISLILKLLYDQLVDLSLTIDEVRGDIEDDFKEIPGLIQVLNMQNKRIKRDLKKAEKTLDNAIEKNLEELEGSNLKAPSNLKTNNDSHQVKQVFNGPVGKTIEGDSHQYGDFYMGSNKKK